MEFITHKAITALLWFAFVYLIAITAWYIVTVVLWMMYQANGGKASYLRYLQIKKLHLTKRRKYEVQ